jgi:SAM-dependent methyltransferase
MSDLVYGAAELYELAFSYRDYAHECDVLEAWYRRASGKTKIDSVLELASGPALHAIELGRRGARAAALDLSPAMCRLAEQRAEEAGVALETKCADMIDFDFGRRFDLAILMINSVAHIYSHRDLVRHFQTIARHLNPGGIFILEIQHPKDFAGRGARRSAVSKPWKMTRGELEVETRWGSENDPYDAIAQIFEPTVEMIARERGHEQRLVERVRMRDYGKPELDAAVAMSGAFEIAQMHGEFAADAPFDNTDASWRMIAVLRRLL